MDQPSSIGSRIRASASALLTDFSTNVSPSSVTLALASALGNDGKSLSMSTFGDYSTLASSSRIDSSPFIHSYEKIPGGVDLSGEQGFRTRPVDINDYEGAEQRDVELMLSNQDGTWPSHSKWSTKESKDEIDQLYREGPSWYSKGGRQAVNSKEAYDQSFKSIYKAGIWPDEDFDGAAVISLLSSPNFTTTQTLEDGDSDEAPDHGGNSNYKHSHIKPPNNIDPSQTAILNRLHLLPDPNLIKDLGTINGVNYSLVYDPEPSSTEVSSDPPSALAAMQQPWIDILHSYQDEVWDPSPLVLPREEVYSDTMIPQGATTTPADLQMYARGKCPASSRLAMIRRHIDFSAIW